MLGPLLSPIGKECGRQSVRSLGFASKRIRCRVDVDEEYVQATSRMLSMSVTVRSKTTERKGARKRATEMREEGRGLVRWGSIVESLKGQGAGRKRKSSQYEHGSGVGQWTGLPMCPSHGAFPTLFTGSALQFLGLPATDRGEAGSRGQGGASEWANRRNLRGPSSAFLDRPRISGQSGRAFHLNPGSSSRHWCMLPGTKAGTASTVQWELGRILPALPCRNETNAGWCSPQPSTEAHRRCRLNPRAKCGKWDSKRLAKILFRLDLKTALPRSWHDEELGRLQS